MVPQCNSRSLLRLIPRLLPRAQETKRQVLVRWYTGWYDWHLLVLSLWGATGHIQTGWQPFQPLLRKQKFLSWRENFIKHSQCMHTRERTVRKSMQLVELTAEHYEETRDGACGKRNEFGWCILEVRCACGRWFHLWADFEPGQAVWIAYCFHYWHLT